MKRILNKNILFILVISFLMSLPIISNIVPGATVDLGYHLTRIKGLNDAISSHEFPVFIYPYANNGFGYASPMFYPDLFLLIPVFLYRAGMPIILSYKIFLVLINIVTSSLSYVFFRYTFKEKKYLTYLCVVLYCFCDYRIALTYQASALGNVMGMMFIPLLSLSFYKFFIERKNCWIQIGLSYTFLLLSHVLSFVIGVFLFALFIIIDLIKNKFLIDRFICVVKAAFFAVGLTAFFLLPMIEQMQSQTFWYEFLKNTTNKDMMESNRYNLIDIFSSFTLDRLLYGKTYNDHRYIGTILSAGSIVCYSVYKIKVRKKSIVDCLFVIFLILLLVQLKSIPIDLLKPLYTMQFLWRFDAFLIPISIFIIGVCLSNINNRKLSVIIYTTILIFCLFNTTIIYKAIDKTTNGYTNQTAYDEIIENGNEEKMLSQTNNINLYELVNGEYLPYTNSYDYHHANTNIEFANEDSAVWDFERIGTTITFHTNYDYNDYIYMPLSWYKGYYYQELSNDGSVLYESECTYNEYTKRVGIYMEKGEHNYKVFYKGTIVQKVSLIISLATVVIFSYIQIKYKKIKFKYD